MGLIDIYKILLIKPDQLDIFLSQINVSLNTLDSTYAQTLILANIFAYTFIILFMFMFFIVLRNLKRRIRRIFS